MRVINRKSHRSYHAKLVVGYLRVSTAEQERSGGGISIQRQEVCGVASRLVLKIDKFYEDRAATGVIEGRPALQRLLRDCRKGVIDTVVIPSTDRLSRDVRIAENLFWRFQNMGIKVLIADMPTYSVTDRRLVFLRQIREAIAEENRKDIIEQLWKGRQERVRQGKPPGGMVPYGYRRRGKQFVAHPVESVIVRLVFKMSRNGDSATAIAAELNERGYRLRNGTHWTPRQVRAIANRGNLYEQGQMRYGSVTATNRKLILVPAQ